MLLLLLLLHAAYSTASHSQKNFTIKHADCPDVGYFVQRELAPNALGPGPCFLCFCQEDGRATCWRREDWRCDAEKHQDGKRDTRVRRAAALGDIFFRDATRDVFNRNLPEQCKPFESSFSDGCPPVDWCLGCTVCDCDANGHWDCHILSFCDPTTKKPSKKRKGNYRRTVIRKAPVVKNQNTHKSVTIKPVAKPQPKIIRKVVRKPAILNTRSKRQPPTQKNINKKQLKNIHRPTSKPKKIIKKKPQKKIIKKEMARKPVEVNKSNQIVLPSTPKFAQAVIQRVLEAVQQLLRSDVRKGNSSKILNAVDKKSLTLNKRDGKALIKRFSTVIRQGAKAKSKDNNKAARNKREVDEDDHLNVISVVPLVKDNKTVSDKILPLQQVETTTEHTTINILRYTVNNNSLTTNPTPTILETEPTLYYDVNNVNNDLTDTPIETTTVANVTTTTTEMSETKMNTVQSTPNNIPNHYNNNITSEKWKEIMNITKNVPDVKIATENIIHLLNNMTNVNDLKFKKWYQIKLLKDREKYLKMGQFKEKDINMFNNHGKSRNESFGILRPNVYSQDIKRKIDIPKRNKLRKIIMTPRLQKDSLNATFLNKKVSTLQNIFKNILKEFNKKTTKVKPTNKNINIVKYMRNLFSNLLRKGKLNITKSKTEMFLEKQHIINMLCENIGSCNLNPRNRKLLDAKVTQLGVETDKVLKIIIIIKGLLHLVEIPNDDLVRNSISKPKPNFKDDVNKLNIILRDSYIQDLKSVSLSQTQTTQIDYIKKNTQEFIHTIANFGKILNEIITILKKNNRTLRKRKVNESSHNKNNNFSYSQALHNLRNLLIRYDTIQNSLFKKIQDSLKVVEMKLNKDNEKGPTVDKELKNMANIDTFSRNIITNLRKLTQLAQNMNSRSKRETMKDNDAVEYLLMLMEYLLKQNHSLDSAPANDGIDMLIEAIKNAPDIKPIRKKVLQYTPATFPTRTVPVKVKKVKERSKTTTVKKQFVVTSKLDDPKFVEPIEEERDYEDKFLYTRRAIDGDGEIENKASSVAIKTDFVSEYLRESNSESISDIKAGNVAVNNSSEVKTEKIDTKESGEEKKYDIFNADIGDFIMFASTTPPSTHSTADITSIKESKTTKSTGTTKDIDNKNIEWIDEGYENFTKDIKDVKKLGTTKAPAVVTRTKKATSKAEENISSITKEIKDEADRRKVTSVEDVAFKKQMDLLNSLDYVTDKMEFDIESKDMEDPFPSYFG